MRRTLLAIDLTCGLCPTVAAAHPHVFVDVSLTVRYDAQGRLSAVDEVWSYNDLYSLLIISEVGGVGQGGFRADQMRIMEQLDPNWDPRNGGKLTMDTASGSIDVRPARYVSTMLEGSNLVTRRTHNLAEPVAGDVPVLVHIYDPTYYVAFSMPSQVTIQGRAECSAVLVSGNRQAQGDAYETALQSALSRELGRAGTQVQVDIGAIGADSIQVLCAP